MNLDLNTKTTDNQTVLTVSGEIDAYTAPKLKQAFQPMLEEENQEIIVDLEKVSYMDSTGLGVFIGVLKSAKEKGSSLELINIQERVYRLFHITGLEEIMNLKAIIQGGNKV
ncbi:STAS domain-containing protein [Oceanobacillus sp. CAU 1775]